MPFRVIAVFLTFVLLCSGFAAPGEAIADLGQDVQQHGLTLGDERHHPGGSTDDDRSADLPPQLQVESAHDPLLLEHPASTLDPTLTMAQPRLQGLASLPAPFLEGPQRPPCPAGITA